MFGRDKTQPTDTATQTRAESIAESAVKVGGKGRATPSRKESEQRNRTPLVGAPAVRAGATKEERKAAKQAQTARNREERAKQRQALASGDERYLPVRDKGPARRYVRDLVDGRRNMGEYFLPVALVAVVLGMVNLNVTRLISLVGLYGLVVAIFIDAMLLRRRAIRQATEKFGADQARGVGGYAVMRSLQIRRSPLPKPAVDRGQPPRA